MSAYDNDHLCSLRAALLEHPIYTHLVSVADLRQFMEDHVMFTTLLSIVILKACTRIFTLNVTVGRMIIWRNTASQIGHTVTNKTGMAVTVVVHFSYTEIIQ